MFVYEVLHRVLAFLVDVQFFFILQVFIPIYRGFERRWELAVTSTCLAWSFDSSSLIFFLIWYLSYEELISNPFLFQRNNVCSNIVVILVLIWRQVAEMVVAETCSELVVVHFVHRTCQLWWSGFWWEMLLITLLLMTCLQELFFRPVTSDALQDVQSRKKKIQLKSNPRIQTSYNKEYIKWL